ncbi:hypothetical protein PL81_36985 [Streptomyces sp. RSD-27]|nr:hypothetical protein PL81_36985 [Streptomyces sp. RSD-27]
MRRLTAPGRAALAVPEEVRVIDRFRTGSGGLRVTLAWPARLRGTAVEGPLRGVVRPTGAYAGPGLTLSRVPGRRGPRCHCVAL